jgi:hypothetical protein
MENEAQWMPRGPLSVPRICLGVLLRSRQVQMARTINLQTKDLRDGENSWQGEQRDDEFERIPRGPLSVPRICLEGLIRSFKVQRAG